MVLAGDSAGGGLALATALALRDTASTPPAALVLFSPWVDVAMRDAPATEPPGEAMLSVAWAAACAAHYLGETAADAPLASPLFADLRGLPPTLIQAGTDELLHGQALQLETALLAAGVETRCEITAHRWHVFQTNGGVLRSADEAIERVARFVMRPVATAADAAGRSASNHEVVILGAGMSGLCAAVKLKRAGIHDFVILEKQDGLGGNLVGTTPTRAPMSTCRRRCIRSPSHPTPAGHAASPGRPRSRPTCRRSPPDSDCSRTSAWARASPRPASTRPRANGTSISRAQPVHDRRCAHGFFMCSTGPLSQPRWPDIPGLDDFQGKRLHSARWDHGYAMSGQRGRGDRHRFDRVPTGGGRSQKRRSSCMCSSAPPTGCCHGATGGTSDSIDCWRTFPPYAAMVRWNWTQVLEWGRSGFDEGTLARKALLSAAGAHRKKTGERRRAAAPAHAVLPASGASGIIYSNDFYPALMRPQRRTGDRLDRANHRARHRHRRRPRAHDRRAGVRHRLRRRASSVIDPRHRPAGPHARRPPGRRAPRRITASPCRAFRTCFLMLGPNTATGHTSTLLYIEPEVDHAIACMQAVRAGNHRWIDVRPEVSAQAQRAPAGPTGSIGVEPVPQLVPDWTTAASSRSSRGSRASTCRQSGSPIWPITRSMHLPVLLRETDIEIHPALLAHVADRAAHRLPVVGPRTGTARRSKPPTWPRRAT